MQLCRCGCGTEIPKPKWPSHQRYYIKGHNTRERVGVWVKDKVKSRTSRARAKTILIKENRYGKCYISNQNCRGRLEVHHIDKNPFNNNSDNIVCLCQGHHKMADYYKLNLTQLSDVSIRETDDGRRYSNLNLTYYPSAKYAVS